MYVSLYIIWIHSVTYILEYHNVMPGYISPGSWGPTLAKFWIKLPAVGLKM